MKRDLTRKHYTKCFALHDAEGNVRRLVTKSSGLRPPPVEGLTWTEVPDTRHRLKMDNGRCVPYLPDQLPIEKGRARMDLHTTAEARKQAAIQRKLEQWAREQPDVKAACDRIDAETRAACEAVDACARVEDVQALKGGGIRSERR